ncbi:hypothetical protein EJB05_05938, partial [Eragrostis curvula]
MTQIIGLRSTVSDKLRAAIVAGAAAVRVHHVERLRVPGAHDALEARAHVHDVPLAAAAARRRDDARAHGHWLQRAQHPPVRGAALAPHRVAAALAVAVRAPRLLLHQLPAAAALGTGGRKGGALLGAVALERDAHEAGCHLAHQRRRGRGELEKQRGARARVHLEREVDVAAAVAVERAGEPRAEPDLTVPPGDGRGQRRAQPRHRRAALLALLLLLGRRRLGRRGHEVLRVERRAAGGERHGRLVLVVGALAGEAFLRAMAAALAKNRPLEVPPGEGEGPLMRASRHDGPHGFFLAERVLAVDSGWRRKMEDGALYT